MSSVGQAITSGQQVLIADRKRSQKIERKTTIVVNSRDRNVLNYPNTNSFRWLLRRPLKDIVSIELVNGSIPGYIYNINNGWNKFTFQEAGVRHTVTLTPGFYSPTELAAQLETQLNSLPMSTNEYSIVVSPTTQKMTVTRILGTGDFYFLFYNGDYKDEFDAVSGAVSKINTPARFLGFGYNDYAEQGGVISAPMAMDTENFLTRAYLYLNAESNTELHRMERAAGQKDCFHIFFFQPGASNYVVLNKDTETPFYASHPAPISRLSFLDVSIRDEFFRLLDLNNRDINLVFEITHLE
jgi:hypothetical protein